MFNLAAAPIPFVIGCPAATFRRVQQEVDLDDVFVFDIDAATFLSYPAFDNFMENDPAVLLRNALAALRAAPPNSPKPLDAFVLDEVARFYHTVFGWYAATARHDPATNTVRLNLRDAKANPVKSARPLFRAVLTTQLCDVVLESRERVLNTPGANLRFVCPLLVPPSPARVARFARDLGLDAPRCKFCLAAIAAAQPCSLHANAPCHTQVAARRLTPSASAASAASASCSATGATRTPRASSAPSASARSSPPGAARRRTTRRASRGPPGASRATAAATRPSARQAQRPPPAPSGTSQRPRGARTRPARAPRRRRGSPSSSTASPPRSPSPRPTRRPAFSNSIQ